VSSGVEIKPGLKGLDKIEEFLTKVRALS
jgi:phosphoribosylanthranilate isomerase